MRAARLCLCMLCAKLWVGTAESQTVCAHTSKLLSRKEAAEQEMAPPTGVTTVPLTAGTDFS